MAEWHVTPDYIVGHWTHELLDLMLNKLAERKERESDARNRPVPKGNTVSDAALFARAGNLVKVETR